MLGKLPAVAHLLLGRGVHLASLTAVLADRYGARPALEDDAPTPGLHPGGARTYEEVETAVARLAAAHREYGAGRGETVLVAVDNRIDVLLHALALVRAGALPALVNPRLKPHEVAAVAAATGATRALADDDLADALSPADGLTELTWVRTGDRQEAPTSVAGWLRADDASRLAPPDRADPEDTALLLTTSGTTGLPKAAGLSSRGLLSAVGRLAAAPLGAQAGPRGGRDLALAALPLPHVMGFVVMLSALCAGVPLIHRHRFDAGEVLDLIEARRPNAFAGVPTMYADLEAAGAADRDLRSVQLWVSSADTMPTDRARRFQRYGAAFVARGRPVGAAAFADIYGMVELSGGAAVRLLPPSPVARVTVPAIAAVLPGVEVRAVDEDGEPVRLGRVGELQFRGAGVIEGYEGGGDAGADAEGWFATGDYGRIWLGGLFAFSGRKKDRLKVGGFSVFPAEVEEELRMHPGVADVAVVGVPDERLGDRPVALVVPADGAFDPDDFLAWAREEVAGYRRPARALVVEDLPRGNNDKLDRANATARAERLLEQEGT